MIEFNYSNCWSNQPLTIFSVASTDKEVVFIDAPDVIHVWKSKCFGLILDKFYFIPKHTMAKDLYHDAVTIALKKEGWVIIEESYQLKPDEKTDIFY